MKTQSRTEYLMECLAYHERRSIECMERWKDSGCRSSTEYAARRYHLQQVKWFLKKLSEPVRINPMGTISKQAPLGQFTKPDFDKPFRDSIAASESLPKSEEPVVKKPQYPEEDYESFKPNLTRQEFEDCYYQGEPSEPTKPTFLSRLWNVFKRK